MLSIPITDLNYRIDLPDTDVRQLIASDPRGSDIKVMLKYDQASRLSVMSAAEMLILRIASQSNEE